MIVSCICKEGLKPVGLSVTVTDAGRMRESWCVLRSLHFIMAGFFVVDCLNDAGMNKRFAFRFLHYRRN